MSSTVVVVTTMVVPRVQLLPSTRADAPAGATRTALSTAAGQKHVAIGVIRRLVDHHLAHPGLIPASYRDTEADPVTQVVDYVSGMTDRFALAMHDRLFDADASSEMTPLLHSSVPPPPRWSAPVRGARCDRYP